MRASSIAGIIFANAHDEALGELTAVRSMASVPFGGRYRIVDFCLSNLVNAGVSNVGIITKENYRSLMDHIGSGIYWDLDRKNGGVRILPPFNISGARRYHGYIEALKNARDFIRRCQAGNIVLCNASTVANIDIAAVVDAHITKGADITMVYHEGNSFHNNNNVMSMHLNENDRVVSVDFKENIEPCDKISIGLFVFNRKFLIELIDKTYENGGQTIEEDIILGNVDKLNIYGYHHSGFAAVMNDIDTYIDVNMKLLEPEIRHDLFNQDRPIYTKTRDDMPTRYGTKSDVSNSFIASGCVIDGTVKNSILFRGVKVAKGAVIEDAILMQGVAVGENAQISRVIADKDVTISSSAVVKGTPAKAIIIDKKKSI